MWLALLPGLDTRRNTGYSHTWQILELQTRDKLQRQGEGGWKDNVRWQDQCGEKGMFRASEVLHLKVGGTKKKIDEKVVHAPSQGRLHK